MASVKFFFIRIIKIRFWLFTAGLFILPGKLWKIMEGGMIESFGTEGKAMILLSEDARYDEAITMEAVVEKYVKVMGQKSFQEIK